MLRPAIALIAILLLVPMTPVLAAENYKIDAVHSMVIFQINHLGISNSIGRFNDIGGSYVLDSENPSASSFTVTIKADSIDTASERRDTHLNSPDFFNSKQFPEITLKSKSVEKTDDDTYGVTAELMLHGVTKEIQLEIDYIGSGKDPGGNFRTGFGTRFSVKRSDFGMNFMQGGIGDVVELTITIEGVRE
jgi:polyisoprenoid-binding protein YceI